VKNLHLTLAYQFPKESFAELSQLVETLDTNLAHSWELRLYSRDTILSTKHVHKAIYPHTSREPDEVSNRLLIKITSFHDLDEFVDDS
jgi:hypothetical protein